MKTTLKILMFIILFSIICITSVNAASILMNLDDYAQETTNAVQTEGNLVDTNIENQIENQFDDNVLNEQTNTIIEPEDEDEVDTPKITSSTTTSNDDEFLTAENILSIIIIVIGILLVFLAVAILIRVK